MATNPLMNVEEIMAQTIVQDQDVLEMWARKATYSMGALQHFDAASTQRGIDVDQHTRGKAPIISLAIQLLQHYMQFDPKLEGFYGALLTVSLENVDWFKLAALIFPEVIKLSTPNDPAMREEYEAGYHSFTDEDFPDLYEKMLMLGQKICMPDPEEPLEDFDE